MEPQTICTKIIRLFFRVKSGVPAKIANPHQ